MKNNKFINISITISIYVTLCLVFGPLSFGVIQFRLSEILSLLAIKYKYAIIANFIGCFISNLLLGGFGIVDVVVGSFASLLACLFAYLLRNKKYKDLPILSCLAIVITNGIIVGIELGILTSNVHMIPITILQITISEFVVIMFFGLPIYNKLINTIKEKKA